MKKSDFKTALRAVSVSALVTVLIGVAALAGFRDAAHSARVMDLEIRIEQLADKIERERDEVVRADAVVESFGLGCETAIQTALDEIELVASEVTEGQLSCDCWPLPVVPAGMEVPEP